MDYNLYYKYYDKYDKNIIGIHGGGSITQSEPPTRHSRTDTIKNTWNINLRPIPPTFKKIYNSNPNLTNGYLNKNNYVVNHKNIDDSYYPSQKINKINLINNTTNNIVKKNINKKDPIKSPPPLITTKIKKKKNKEYKKIKENNNDKINNDKINFLQYIKNNSLYDGKYIYTIENNFDNININKFNDITFYPFELKKKDYKNNIDNLEFFSSLDINNNIFNLILIIIFIIILFIYYCKN
jgi:hypothetical protein